VGGFVSPIPLDERFVQWKSEVDVDAVTFIASLAGEQLFYEGDHTQGVGGDMAAATSLVTRGMLSHAMGPTLRAFNASSVVNSGLVLGGTPLVQGMSPEGEFAQAIEIRLKELYERAREVLAANRHEVLSVTHALEMHKTISGEDVAAIIEGRVGPLVDGTLYATKEMKKQLEAYHAAALAAHKVRDGRPPALPELPQGLSK
jgi:ATP-dependent Zn protease